MVKELGNPPPSNPGGSMNEKIRSSEQFRIYLIAVLRNKLKSILLPPNFESIRNIAAPDLNNFASFDDYLEAMVASDPATPEQLEILDDMVRLKTIEDFRAYCKNKKIDIDLDSVILEAEKNYETDQGHMAALRVTLDEIPELGRIRKDLGFDEPKKPS